MVKFFKIGLLTAMLIPITAVLHAQVTSATEYEVKAAFLYNFAKFVEWPPDAFKNSADSFVIGILGDDPFGKDVEEGLTGKRVQDKRLIVKRLAAISDASDCQVVFISASEEPRLVKVLDGLKMPAVLTVSDMKGFIERGGMVGFALENNRVRFSINRTAAQNAGLKISSQLLKLAKVIVKTIFGKPIG